MAKILEFPKVPGEPGGGVYASGRTDGGSDILVARDLDGRKIGELYVRPGMSRQYAGELLRNHLRAWEGLTMTAPSDGR